MPGARKNTDDLPTAIDKSLLYDNLFGKREASVIAVSGKGRENLTGLGGVVS